MRIVGGAWRSRALVAPPGQGTRPTADRVRQALFDMLMHAAWGGRGVIEGAVVLDVFAGTGALGLEALSRGAASACFIEQDAAALRALRANVAACKAADRVEILAGDALRVAPPRWYDRTSEARPGPSWLAEGLPETGPTHTRIVAQPVMTAKKGSASRMALVSDQTASLVFFDPPYSQNLVPRALRHLREIGCIAAGALVVAEMGREETWLPEQPLVAERQHGAARILIFRVS